MFMRERITPGGVNLGAEGSSGSSSSSSYDVDLAGGVSIDIARLASS
ncbi:hypothetical protein [Rhodopirellula europaea]